LTNIRNPRGGWLYLFVILGGLAGPLAPAHADASGFEASLRFGYGFALGELREGSDLADGIAGQMPFWLDLGYRVTPELMVGLYASYGIGFVGGEVGDSCDAAGDAVDCSASDIRLGIQAQFHLQPKESVDPWLGLGIGYEWLSLGIEGAGAELSTTASGFEFVNLQVGLDFRIKPTFSLGPFIAFSLAQYSDVSVDCSGVLANVCDDVGADIDAKALHEWLFIGARGTFSP
jgi:hypothetical protein